MLMFQGNNGTWQQGTVAVNQTPFAGFDAGARRASPMRQLARGKRRGFGDWESDLDSGGGWDNWGDTTTVDDMGGSGAYDSGMSAADEADWISGLDDPNPQNANGGGFDSGTTQAEDDQWIRDLDASNPQSSGGSGVPDVPIDWSKIAGVAGQVLQGAGAITATILAARAKTQAAANAAAALALKGGATRQSALVAGQRRAQASASSGSGIASSISSSAIILPLAVGGAVLAAILLLRK